MKRLTALSFLLSISLGLLAQSVKDESITFKYIQYPLQNQGADVKTFSSNVYVKYEEDIAAAKVKEKEEHDRLVAEDQAKYEQLLAEYQL